MLYIIIKSYLLPKGKYVCVAQLDRASGYGPEGREFESCHTHYYIKNPCPRLDKGFVFHSMTCVQLYLVRSTLILSHFVEPECYAKLYMR